MPDRPLPRLERAIEAVVGDRLGAGVYRRWVASLGLRGDERTLEVGCGAGACSRHLARALPAGTLTCIDVDSRWLRIARERLARAGAAVEFIEADATRWRRAGGFDAIVVHFLLHDLTPAAREAALENAAASLAPRGRLYVREPTQHGMSEAGLLASIERAGLVADRAPERQRVPLMGPCVSGAWTRA